MGGPCEFKLYAQSPSQANHISEVLQNEIRPRRNTPAVVGIVAQNVDARLIVGIECSQVALGLVIGEALGQIHPEAVHMVFLQPILEHPLAKGTGVAALMVKVVAHPKIMRGIAVKPRVVDGWRI